MDVGIFSFRVLLSLHCNIHALSQWPSYYTEVWGCQGFSTLKVVTTLACECNSLAGSMDQSGYLYLEKNRMEYLVWSSWRNSDKDRR